MKQYNVVVTNDDKKKKKLQVNVETYKDFLEWLRLLHDFERNEKISQIKVKSEREVF